MCLARPTKRDPWRVTRDDAGRCVRRGTCVGHRATIVHRFEQYRLTPLETRQKFDAMGCKTVVGFQTRNPVHRAHRVPAKGRAWRTWMRLLHPLVGATKSDDFWPADVRMRTYEAILEKYYPQNRVVLAVRSSGNAVCRSARSGLAAISRKNYGCPHFIVGRDHAGVGNYYGSYGRTNPYRTACRTHDSGSCPSNSSIRSLCTTCGNLASPRTCPHGKEHHVTAPGTKVREMLTNGDMPPSEFTRPEIAAILTEAYQTPTSKCASSSPTCSCIRRRPTGVIRRRRSCGGPLAQIRRHRLNRS